MKLSLSVRVAESLSAKRVPAMSLESLAKLAVDNGYRAVCMFNHGTSPHDSSS